MKSIYCVVAVDKNGHSRCWAWYPNKEEAKDHMRQGAAWFFENGTYKYAVIEKVRSGIVVGNNEEYWFSVNYDPRNSHYDITPMTSLLSPISVIGACND